MAERRSDLARVTLSVTFIGGLIAGSVWILRPFLAAFIWAVMIVVATWPILCRVQRALWGSRGLAVAVMCLSLLAILLVPLGVALDAILTHADDIPVAAAPLVDARLPAAPAWLASVPLFGPRAADAWSELSAQGTAHLADLLNPYLRAGVSWFVRRAGSFAVVLLEFVLIVILSSVLYAGGEGWAAWVRRFGARLADAQGERMVILAGQAIRGVALGVVVTAVVQSLLGGLGLVVAGVPFVAILTAIMFMLCIAQIGPLLVLLACTAWVWRHAGSGWGTLMLVWSLAVGLMDNFLRPVLIRQGAELPLLLIVGGVVGGLVAFGVVGIFVGPVVLAVAYTLLDDWVSGERA
ncbi:MAG: AI-2E family transporter YdiK [Thermodesulfobacteriota bacterium]